MRTWLKLLIYKHIVILIPVTGAFVVLNPCRMVCVSVGVEPEFQTTNWGFLCVIVMGRCGNCAA